MSSYARLCWLLIVIGILIDCHQVVLVNKKKWTVAGQVLASRGERQNDVMDIFQVPRVTNVDIYKLIRI